jgi:hypothetical protein
MEPTAEDPGSGRRSGATAGGEAGRRIAEEHRALGEVLARVEAATDLPALLAALGELRALLIPHFAGEEADEGFEGLLGRRAPHLLGHLEHVLGEHGEILEDLDRLTAQACACLEGPVAAVLREGAALAARLHAHEAKETELLVGAVYTDLGTAS